MRPLHRSQEGFRLRYRFRGVRDIDLAAYINCYGMARGQVVGDCNLQAITASGAVPRNFNDSVISGIGNVNAASGSHRHALGTL